MNKDLFVGIDAGGTNIKCLLVDSDLNPICETSFPTRPELGYERISDIIISELEKMLSSYHLNREVQLQCIGMGLPGVVDKTNQKTLQLALLKWNGFNPCKKIAQHFGASSVIDNDANVNLLGESRFGFGNRYENIVMLTLGTGVGSAIMINKQIFRGHRNFGGELGHMTIQNDGELCLCGQRGHLEAYCSGRILRTRVEKLLPQHRSSILYQLTEKNGNHFDNRFIHEGLKANDLFAKQVLDWYVYYLSIGIANILQILNPEMVILGGGIANLGKILIDPLKAAVIPRLLSPEQMSEIQQAKLGPKAGMYGAAIMAINQWKQ